MSTYIRQYIIQVLSISLIASCFMAISIFGNEEIFPKDTKVENGNVAGLPLDYYVPKDRSYFEKLFLITGIPYLLIVITFIFIYSFLFFANNDCRCFRPFRRFMLRMRSLQIDSLSFSNTIFYQPEKYDPGRRKIYRKCLPIVREN